MRRRLLRRSESPARAGKSLEIPRTRLPDFKSGTHLLILRSTHELLYCSVAESRNRPTDADKLRAGLARPWPTGQVAARTPARPARGVTGQTASFIRLFDRHCSFETLRPQPHLIFLTSSAPKRTAMATICLTSSRLPAASSQLLDPRKRHLPLEGIETAPSVFGAPDMATRLLTSSHLPAPSAQGRPPSVMLSSPPHQHEERTRSLHCLEERPLISPSVERDAHQLRRGWQAGCPAAGMTAAVVS
jgi:hypothetical protein